jgi:uncharacterized protein GlcG (DUF336 family)
MFSYSCQRKSIIGVSVLLIAWSIALPIGLVQALPISHQLPMGLAVEAATASVNACQKKGYAVTATITTKEGMQQVMLKGDGAAPHTIENSFNKAYTVISLGSVQKVASTSEIVKSMTPSPNPVGNWPMASSPLPGITFTAGGMAIKVGDEIIGGLGVSGAPGGNYDEECAQAGINKIRDRLTL